MKSSLKSIARSILHAISADSIVYRGMVLPAQRLRHGGPEFKDDTYFLASSQEEADRLVRLCGLTKESCVLDIGCGVGRLAIGILSRVGEIRRYRGVDVSQQSIAWCQRYIARAHPAFQFVHIDVQNPRYNPQGSAIGSDFHLPFRDVQFDIIYLYSVFSHLLEGEVRAYLAEFRRLLAPAGRIFLTAFIEEGVPQVSINPPGYRMEWAGPLHCVRYEKDFFESMLAGNGLKIDAFDYATETNGQSGLIVSHRE